MHRHPNLHNLKKKTLLRHQCKIDAHYSLTYERLSFIAKTQKEIPPTFVNKLNTTGTCGSSPANILHPRLPVLSLFSLCSLCPSPPDSSPFPFRSSRAWGQNPYTRLPRLSCDKIIIKLAAKLELIYLL